MRKGRSSYLFYKNERIITKQENAKKKISSVGKSLTMPDIYIIIFIFGVRVI